MLEVEGVLATWELRVLPADWSEALNLELGSGASSVPAIRLADHRLAYLEYEGPLSGDRGSVNRVEGGTYKLLERTDSRWEIHLQGAELQGQATLVAENSNWRLEVEMNR